MIFLQITKLCLLATRVFHTERGSQPCETLPPPCVNEWRTDWTCLEQPNHSQLFTTDWDYRFTKPGRYIMQLSAMYMDEGNTWQGILRTDTFLIGEKPDLYLDSYTICEGTPFKPIFGTTPINWDTLPTAPRTTYQAITANEFCSTTETMTVKLTNCSKPKPEAGPPAVYVPNAFSPNGDGINDLFQIEAPPGADVLSCEIYGRWGGLVSRVYPWDGFGAEPGVYVAKIAIVYNDRIYTYTTELNLIL